MCLQDSKLGIMVVVTLYLACLAAQAPLQTSTAQTASPQSTQPTPEVVFHATTRLVQVNVVVHDHQGKPVGDLKKEDFSIAEKGKPQEISFFSVDSLDKPLPSVSLPPDIFSNRLGQRPGVSSSVTVILLDALNTTFSDQVYARRAVIDFLLQVKPKDHIAIYRLGSELQILHDYSTDSNELVNLLQNARSELLANLEAAKGSETAFDLRPILGLAGPESSFFRSFFTEERIIDTLAALEAVANHMASFQGRKNLVWVSGGFPLAIGRFGHGATMFTTELERTERAMDNADVTIYPVDARGLMAPNEFSAQRSSSSIMASSRIGVSASAPVSTPLDSMIELANRTGGRAFYNRNDLDHAIRDALADSEITYTLGYHPKNEEMDGKFREIKVQVDRKGVEARYRKGYFALGAPEDAKDREEQLLCALWSPLDATALLLNARVDLVNQPQPNSIHVIFQVDASGLNFVWKDGRYFGKVDFFLSQRDERGNQLGQGADDSVNMDLKPETYAKVMQEGLIYQKTFPREQLASTLRLLARDTSTGAIGSLTVALNDVK